MNDPLKNIKDTYDVVTCWAVLEHVRDPSFAVESLVKLCKPGGLIFCSTPEIGTALTNHSPGRSRWFYPPEHLCLLSPKGTHRLFHSFGCDTVEAGRLEFNSLRYAARYGIGVAEAMAGFPVKLFANKMWRRMRDSRKYMF